MKPSGESNSGGLLGGWWDFVDQRYLDGYAGVFIVVCLLVVWSLRSVRSGEGCRYG
jgi:hypothetical protein